MDPRNSTTGGDLPVIPVYMPDEEVKRFLVFQQHYQPISILVDNGVFEQKNATILLDFDKDGVLKSVRRQDYLFSARA
jgi:hypothetical protein